MEQPVNTGAEFEAAEVARSYRSRPPYPAALHARLLELSPRRHRLVDLGCGPGKLARALAGDFREVFAVDPSRSMLEEGQALDAGVHRNIQWVESTGEAFDFPEACDLVVAAASMHWMEPGVLFPKLATALQPDGVVAVTWGDSASDAPWLEAYRAFITRWLTQSGRTPGDPAFLARGARHLDWMVDPAHESFSSLVRQPLEDFIDCEHSRATWTRAKMGPDLAARFDEELANLLSPYVRDGAVEYMVRAELQWGCPRAALN